MLIAFLPILALALLSALPYALNLLPYLSLRNLIPVLSGLVRKKRDPWGIVYDAKTKLPLDPVILTLTDEAGKTRQTVSDIYGRYEFLVEPGIYYLKAEKTHYQFPSTLLAGKRSDSIYDNLYFGEKIVVMPNQKVMFNVPMDCQQADWNEQEKVRLGISKRNSSIYKITNIIFGVGFVVSLISAVTAFNKFNLMIVALYVLFSLLKLLGGKMRAWGVVYTKEHKPASGVVVRLLRPKFPQLRGIPLITMESGRFNFLVQEGDYMVTVEEQPVDGVVKELYRSEVKSIKTKYGHIGYDIRL
ncbi:MAG: hypothetical protein ACD_22C00025G0002 [uncultured bacterium]|nr:MAG: hypothetical protein ACD_22C00025G0002 [uncultured bacterium]